MRRQRNIPSPGVAGTALILAFFVVPESALVQVPDSRFPADGPTVREVRDVDDIGLLESIMFALGWHIAPRTVANVKLLHAYDFSTACKVAREFPANPARFGHVAVIGPVGDLNGSYGASPGESFGKVGLGARYFNDLRSAIAEFTEQTGITCDSQSALSLPVPDGWFIATDQPIPDVQPTQRLVSGGQMRISVR